MPSISLITAYLNGALVSIDNGGTDVQVVYEQARRGLTYSLNYGTLPAASGAHNIFLFGGDFDSSYSASSITLKLQSGSTVVAQISLDVMVAANHGIGVANTASGVVGGPISNVPGFWLDSTSGPIAAELVLANFPAYGFNQTLITLTGLPAGISYSVTGPESAYYLQFSGSASQAGTYYVLFDDGGVDFHLITITITAAPGITTGDLTFQRGAAVTSEIDQNDPAITNAVWQAQNLPPGLIFGTQSAASVQLTGTPTVTGVFLVPVTVSQSGGTVTHSKTINITITPGRPIITVPSNLWNGTTYAQLLSTGSPVSIQLAATDNPTSWTAIGLPDGVTISNSGLISGTPNTTGTSEVTVTASNATGTSDPVTIFLGISSASTGGGTTAQPPSLYLPWLHANPMLVDLQMDLRTGKVQSFYADAGGLYIKAGDDVQIAVVVQDLILGTMLTALDDLMLIVCPADDFESFFAEVQGVEAVQLDGGTYFALELCLDAATCPRLQQAFDTLNLVQGPNTVARTVAAMCELRIETTASVVRRSRLFPMTIEQNASI